MKKNKQKWTLGLSLFSALVVTPIVISAVQPTHTKTFSSANALGLVSQENETTTKPAIDDTVLQQNAGYYQRTLITDITTLINTIDTAINTEITSLIQNDDTTTTATETGQRQSRIFYLQKVKEFLQNNEENIKKDPMKYGFEWIYPAVFATNLKINSGNITYNGKTYEKISFASPADSNSTLPTYAKLVANPSDLTSTGEKDNTVTNEEFIKIFTDYNAALTKDFQTIFLNQEDQPVLGRDYVFTPKSQADGSIVFVASDPLNISGITTWDDYIISKIKPRFADFDLNQNINSQQSQQIQPPPVAPVVPEPEQPPTNPNENVTIDNNETPLPANKATEIRDIPNLDPKITSLSDPLTHKRYDQMSVLQLIQAYNNALTQEQKDQIIYFDNPINKRFTYTFTNLSQSGSTIAGNVHLIDNLVANNTRDYQANVTNIVPFNAAPNAASALQFNTDLEYTKFTTLRKAFNKIQDALKVTDNFDVSKLEGLTPDDQIRVSNILFALTKIVFNQQANNNFQTTITEFMEQAIQQGSNDASLNDFANRVHNLFISYIINSKIDSTPLAQYIRNLLVSRINNLQKLYEDNRLLLNSFYEKLGLSTSDAVLLFNRLKAQADAMENIDLTSNNTAISGFDNLLNLSINANVFYRPLFNIMQLATNQPPIDNQNQNQVVQEFKQSVATITTPTNVTAIVLGVLGALTGALVITIITLRFKWFKKQGLKGK
ncbi:MSC_0620 family F1-like ATPase-associated subunit [[Mycoplasma] testudinis]|uniref:MSC_0620 family F1-like ATPase-associated subunit n=1 Tax=[Mycoplasma] testudinis TaxID=33924 RepID=UPI00047FEEB5|nr:hypothetical protein [[Mycoplasma] testudinis]